MADVTLTLEQALHLANKEDAGPAVRTIGALSAARILLDQPTALDDPELRRVIEELVALIEDAL